MRPLYLVLPDTHLGHEMLVKENLRPANFENQILLNTCRVATENSVLIHLGDVSFYNNEHWHRLLTAQCSGHKILVRGNHDRKTVSWYLKNGWDAVVDSFSLNVYGKHILFSHKPIDNLSGYDFNIHGHFHNTNHHPEDSVTDKHICAYIEHHYCPINLKSLIGV